MSCRRLLFSAVAGREDVLLVVSVRVGGERLLSSAVRDRWSPAMGLFVFVLGRSVVDTIVVARCEVRIKARCDRSSTSRRIPEQGIRGHTL
jgi:hypothetical protein